MANCENWKITDSDLYCERDRPNVTYAWYVTGYLMVICGHDTTEHITKT